MTPNDLARIIAQAQEQGAPEWGVTLIVQQHQLREDFHRHCKADEARRAPWRSIWLRIAEMLAIAVVVWLLMQAPAILGAAR